MKWFFDTSALVPVFLEEHIHHDASLEAFAAAEKKLACCAAHTLAEIYSVLTRLPGPNRLSGDQSLLFLQEVEDRCTLISLDAGEYFEVIQSAAGQGIVGGTIYDALLARCAIKANADTIYTWNLDHFRRLGPEIARRAKTPPG